MDAEQRAAHERVVVMAARAAALGGVGGERQQRNTPPREVGPGRLMPCGAQLRAKLETKGEQQLYHLEGIASVVERPYRMWDMFGEYEEVIAREAFDKTLAAEPDVSFLLNHKGMTMARTTAGTLELKMSDEGLQSEAWLNPKRQDVKDLVIAIDDGNITEMSFAFEIAEGGGWWSEDFSTFRITEVDINRGDVSAVNYGANPYTSISARSREILAEIDHLPTGAARAALVRLSARDDLRTGPPQLVPAVPLPPKGVPSVAFYEQLLGLTY